MTENKMNSEDIGIKEDMKAKFDSVNHPSHYTFGGMECIDEMIEVFPGIIEMLQALKGLGLRLVIVTSKKRDMTLKGLKCLKMFDYFDLIVSSDDILHPKPHPEPIETVLKYYHLNRDECLMVGDNSHDIECANHAGVKSVAVGWAMRGADYLKTYNPTYIINEAKDLLNVVKKEGV